VQRSLAVHAVGSVRVSLSTGLRPSRYGPGTSASCTPQCWKNPTSVLFRTSRIPNYFWSWIFTWKNHIVIVVSPLLKRWNLAWTLNPSICVPQDMHLSCESMHACIYQVRHQFDPSKTFSSSTHGNVAEVSIQLAGLTIDRLHSLNSEGCFNSCTHAISRHHGFELWKHNNHCFLSSSSGLISIQQASRDLSS
jgi:hypothetical protein